MRRILCTLGLLSLGIAWAGCSMCKSPYDYCGPVMGPGGCPNCGYGRVGSAISGGGPPVYQAEGPHVANPGAESGAPAASSTIKR